MNNTVIFMKKVYFYFVIIDFFLYLCGDFQKKNKYIMNK